MGTLTTKAVQLARGAAAGTMATMAMKGVMSLLESKKTSIKDAFQDRQPAEEAIVDRLNKRYKWKMSRPGRTILSRGLRLAIGAGTGAASSYLSRKMGVEGHPFRAAALSAMIFIVVDEFITRPAI